MVLAGDPDALARVLGLRKLLRVLAHLVLASFLVIRRRRVRDGLVTPPRAPTASLLRIAKRGGQPLLLVN
jgi:hypothetical protein